MEKNELEKRYLEILQRLVKLEEAENKTQKILAKILIEMDKKDEEKEAIEKREKRIQEKKDDNEFDNFFVEAADLVIDANIAATSFIQRRFKVGYARAGRIIDQLEREGIISEYRGSKPRDILMKKEEFEKLKETKYKDLNQIREVRIVI